MLRRGRKRRAAPPGDALRAFDAAVGALEEAKASLVAAIPTGRIPGVHLAEALVSFESGIDSVQALMAGWRTPGVEDRWSACMRGLRESSARAERLRLHGTPGTYEELLSSIGDLLEPLDAFTAAAEGFRRSAL